ncbi:MAG: hypothetical protein ABSG22_10680 [Sedimentisphaerales bacterium]|jgi:hypothetical protein
MNIILGIADMNIADPNTLGLFGITGGWLYMHWVLFVTIIPPAYGLIHAIVKLTPSQEDDKIFDVISNYVKTVLTLFHINL